MAEYDPFTPGPIDPAAVDPNAANVMMQFLADPRGRAALLSTGLAMLQPQSFGDSGVSAAARAIGAGGESARLSEAQELKREEVSSKSDLRAAQAMNAEERVRTAGARLDTAATRLGFLEEAERGKNERNRLGNIIRSQNIYNQEKKLWDKQQDPLMLPKGQAPVPFPDYETWLQSKPTLLEAIRGGGSGRGGSGAGGGPDTTVPTGGKGLKIGTERGGYRYIGGDPGSEGSWEKL